ncbi:MAG TPA: fused MFS/spermidine synthase, partial [bacterium]|nr:fused MFS/spermidine synthase [bacterium]
MLTAYIYTAVIIGGAAVLALELLGTRVLAPFYGASLYLWSALIAVTLAALSVGYALGGRWADRGPRLGRFAILFGLAGLWTLLIPLLRDPVLLLTEPFGLRVAVLVTAALLFFPPLALLGMVSPYAIRLKAAQLEEVGRTAGYLYSVSTAASVAAALAIGFFLIPNLGVTRLVAATGLLLLATALWGSMLARRLRSAPLAAAVLLLAGG